MSGPVSGDQVILDTHLIRILAFGEATKEFTDNSSDGPPCGSGRVAGRTTRLNSYVHREAGPRQTGIGMILAMLRSPVPCAGVRRVFSR
jgi:hypothetical protein